MPCNLLSPPVSVQGSFPSTQLQPQLSSPLPGPDSVISPATLRACLMSECPSHGAGQPVLMEWNSLLAERREMWSSWPCGRHPESKLVATGIRAADAGKEARWKIRSPQPQVSVGEEEVSQSGVTKWHNNHACPPPFGMA